MDDLVQWLRAQLDEDERDAQDAPAAPWTVDVSGSIVGDDGTKVVYSVGGAIDGRVSRWPEAPVANHIVRHEPARVLREIDAKRQLLYQFEQRGNSMRATVQPPTGGVWDDMLRLLALPYADRPGYRDEWRP